MNHTPRPVVRGENKREFRSWGGWGGRGTRAVRGKEGRVTRWLLIMYGELDPVCFQTRWSCCVWVILGNITYPIVVVSVESISLGHFHNDLTKHLQRQGFAGTASCTCGEKKGRGRWEGVLLDHEGVSNGYRIRRGTRAVREKGGGLHMVPAEKGKKSSPPSSCPKPLYRTISSPPAKPSLFIRLAWARKGQVGACVGTSPSFRAPCALVVGTFHRSGLNSWKSKDKRQKETDDKNKNKNKNRKFGFRRT